MIDSQTYRIRIGYFVQKLQKGNNISRRQAYKKSQPWNVRTKFILVLLLSLGCSKILDFNCGTRLSFEVSKLRDVVQWPKCTVKFSCFLFIPVKVVDHNFNARYVHGNIQKQKGIINMHLNIRSLRHKMFEVKCLVKEHNPHIFGISETELVRDTIDEKVLKIPGYNILFPSSWSRYGFACVLVYVRKTFKYSQVQDLQDDKVQSIWVKGG